MIISRAFYPEGPLLREGRLFYAEMTQHRVMVWDGRTNAVFWRLDGCGPTSLAPMPNGAFLVLCHLGHKLVLVSRQGETLTVTARDSAGRPVRYPNDAAADDHGGIYISSSGPFDRNAPPSGKILYWAPSGQLREVAGGLHYANGVAVSPDGRALFVSEHLARRVIRFEIKADASLANREVYLDLDAVMPRAPGSGWFAGPDGLEFGPRNTLWIAEYGAGRVLVVDLVARRLTGSMSFPDRFTTNLTFAPGKTAVYVTAARTNRQRPYVGRVYRRQLGRQDKTE